MTEKRVYIGSIGPFLYNDEDTIDHEEDGDFHGESFKGVRTDGTVSAGGDPIDDDDLMRKKDFDSMDGDTLDISYDPEYYTPDDYTPEAEDPNDLAAHLKGIDDAIGELEEAIYGWSGTFTNGDGDVVEVTDGIITNVGAS